MVRGLQIYIPLGIPKLLIESDSLMLVNEVLSDKESMALFGNMVFEIKRLMKCFSKCSIEHIGPRRMANEATHELAKYT